MLKNKRNLPHTKNQIPIQPAKPKLGNELNQSVSSLLPTKIDSRGYNVKAEIIEIDSSLCKQWDFSDRSYFEMGNIEELANSIRTAGQQEPALIRPIKSNGMSNSLSSLPRYEIIFGNRRWRACKLIGKNLLAIVRDLSDQEAAIAQKEENENRKDISDYARAMQYKKLINSGVFTCENHLAMKLNISRQRLNDLMAYTRIPKQLVDAIPNVHKLSRRMAIKLSFLSKNPVNLPLLLKLARKIGIKRISSKGIDAILEKEMKLIKVNPLLKDSSVIEKKDEISIAFHKSHDGKIHIVLSMISMKWVDKDELKIIIKNHINQCRNKESLEGENNSSSMQDVKI